MDRLTIQQVESLFGLRSGWCVSLYLPTHRAGKEIREDPIRLKNRVLEAESKLEAAGVAGGDIKRLCKPARELCDTDAEEFREFWRHSADGLALFLSSDGSEQYRLQGRVDELTVVAHRFHVKPLLHAVQQDGQYCMLTVSENEVRFLEGSRSGLSARPIDQLPESLQAILGGHEDKGFGLHSFRVRANAGDTAVPHGHVESNDEHELNRYFQLIDKALHDALKDDQRPLVFAGVDELFPYFKDAASYGNVVEESVSGNPEDLSEDTLHEKAWPLVEPMLTQQQQDVLDRWQSAEHTDLGGASLKEIVVAAHDGRIETLLLDRHQENWGTYDAEAREVARADAPTAENYDLSDLAAVRTLRSNGRLAILDDAADKLGEDGIAVIFRYVEN